MSRVRVTFRPENLTASVAPGTTILEAARLAGADLASPCDGHGTCGRCRVLLPDCGSVLACRTRVTEETWVDVPPTARTGGTVVYLDASAAPDEIDCRPLDPLSDSDYGIAIDVGTSTVAAELVDVRCGKLLARAGTVNSQAAFGAEVTRRIEHVEDHGVTELSRGIIEDIRCLIDAVCCEADVGAAEIGAIVAAGNTTMIHLLFGIDPSPIRIAPHEPRVLPPEPVDAAALGIEFARGAKIYAIPWIGGWVGGDVISGILAAGLHRDERLTMLIDVGTNGEIVLGAGDWRLSCAASAGPAFEGSGLRNGTTARRGAIERMKIDKSGRIRVSTIDDAPAVGICGSGMISGIAALFRNGWIDRSGGIAPERIIDLGGEPGILWVPAEKTAVGRPIGIVQRDIEAVVRAKAALFAGARSLAAMADLRFDGIERLVVCGGFGSALEPKDAITLGMIPDIEITRIDSLGNTALRGARLALLRRTAWEEAVEIARSTTYVELIDHPTYFEEFTSAKFLPHTDVSLFPSAAFSRRTT